MFSDPVRHSRICRNDITNLWFNERVCVFVCAFPLPAFHRGAGCRNIDRKLPLSDKLEFGGQGPQPMRHGRWAVILHPLGPSTISCYEIGICRAAANNRKPCHPEHSVSDFGFHDCRWQSYLRKMRSVVEGSTHCVLLCSPFRAKILRLRCAWLRMTVFLKCLNLCNKRSICQFV